MANRHLARSIVLQTLFEWDTTNASAKDAEEILTRNAAEFGGDRTRIGLSGDSAGGHLSAAASLMPNVIGKGGFGKTAGVFEFLPSYLPKDKPIEQVRSEMLAAIKAPAPSYGVFGGNLLSHYSDDPAANDTWKDALVPLSHIPKASPGTCRSDPRCLAEKAADEEMIRNNPQGVATLGQWTLGAVVGANSLSATVAGYAVPLALSVTGVVGPAATIAVVEDDGQSTTIGNAVPVAPAAKVTDAFGNVVAGISVTFTPTAGSGTVTGGTAVTDAAGIARVGNWRIGLAPGAHTLTASLSGAASATFTATGVDFPVTGIAAGGGHTCGLTASGTKCLTAGSLLWSPNASGPLLR